MAFSSMLFLAAGGVLATVPIILHLLRRRRKRIVELSTFRFLFETYHVERRTLKILEYLLLTLRVLAILMIGFFFARPVAQPGWLLGGGARARVIILDTSASMAAQDQGVSRLELARRLARELVLQADPSDEFSIIDSNRQAEVLARGVVGDKELLLAKLDAVEQTMRAGRPGPALARAAEILKESTRMRKEVFFFGDLQSQPWLRQRDELQQTGLGRDAVISFVRIGDSEAPNVAVLPEQTAQVRGSVNIPVQAGAVVVNYAPVAREVLLTATAFETANGREVQVHRDFRRLEPGERWSVRALHTFGTPGFHCIVFEITADAFPPDDRLTVTVQVASAVRVLLVDGRPGARPLESDVFYLSRALQPDAQPDAQRRIFVEQSMIPPEQVNPGVLGGRDVVVLADVSALSPASATALRSFVASGGGLLILPGEQTDQAFYNEVFGVEDTDGRLLPAPLVRKMYSNGDPRRYVYLSGVQYTHPVFTLFQGQYAASLAAPRFYGLWEMGEPSRGSNILASFSTNMPAVVERRYGRGKVVLCAFPAGVRWSSFPLRPAYVAFFHQAVAYLRHEQPLALLKDAEIDQALTVNLPPEARRDTVSVTTPSGKRETLQLTAYGDGYRVSKDVLDELGVWMVELKHADGSIESGSFVVRTPAEESVFDTASEMELREALPDCTVSLVERGQDFSATAARLASGRELWRIAAWVAVAILLGEFVLANRSFVPWRRRRPLATGSPQPPEARAARPSGASTKDVSATVAKPG